MPAAIDGPPSRSQNCLQVVARGDITREAWDFWNEDNDLKSLALLGGTNDSLDKGLSNSILYRTIISCVGNAEKYMWVSTKTPKITAHKNWFSM